jgi:hypothetical protein
MRKIVVLLMGGLGNQMFQYAIGRALSLRYEADLILDTWSGFMFDYQYHRKYELDAFPIEARPATALERLPFWFNQLERRLRPGAVDVLKTKFYGCQINEVKKQYLHQVFNYQPLTSCWLTGYWQSPEYFQDYSSTILSELNPPLPKEDKFLQLGVEMRQKASVAIGIRLFEEEKDPDAATRDGRLKTITDLNNAIASLKSQVLDPHFYIFCTYRSPLLSKLHLPDATTTFVTQDDGFEGAKESLWLLSQCRHHLITVSTFYWWGAWLSRKIYSKNSQVILAASSWNVNNINAIPCEWQQF